MLLEVNTQNICLKEEIEKYLPHRPPFQLVEKVVIRESGKEGSGRIVLPKDIGYSDLALEAIGLELCMEGAAQTAGVLMGNYYETRSLSNNNDHRLVQISSVDILDNIIMGSPVNVSIHIIKYFQQMIKFHFVCKQGSSIKIKGEMIVT